MKEILLKKDVIAYLHQEIDHVRRTEPKPRHDGMDFSFAQGYKNGQLDALFRVLNYVSIGVNTRNKPPEPPPL